MNVRLRMYKYCYSNLGSFMQRSIAHYSINCVNLGRAFPNEIFKFFLRPL